MRSAGGVWARRRILIDIALNDISGLTLLHDEGDLAGAQAVLAGPDGSYALVRADGSIRRAPGRVDPAFARDAASATACVLVRMSGGRVVERSTVPVHREA